MGRVSTGLTFRRPARPACCRVAASMLFATATCCRPQWVLLLLSDSVKIDFRRATSGLPLECLIGLWFVGAVDIGTCPLATTCCSRSGPVALDAQPSLSSWRRRRRRRPQQVAGLSSSAPISASRDSQLSAWLSTLTPSRLRSGLKGALDGRRTGLATCCSCA